MNKDELLTHYLTSNTLMQLATVRAGEPWICNVYFVADQHNTIYWTSARSRRHSKEISGNPTVAATIVHDAKHKQSVQMTGRAYEVPLDEVMVVDELYSAKFGKKDRLTEVKLNLPDGRAYYMLTPEHIFLWDEVNFPNDPKQEV
jgi:uncharacterized protein YhbP (UPF0306 family)